VSCRSLSLSKGNDFPVSSNQVARPIFGNVPDLKAFVISRN
jgi:hypothetical protein